MIHPTMLPATTRAATVAVAVAAVVIACGCTTSASTTTAQTPQHAAGLGPLSAEARRDLRQGYDDTVTRLEETSPDMRALFTKAAGVLVFPQTISAGLVVGGEIGNGVLRIDDKFAGYYRITAGSLGLQIGAQSRSLVFLFMTPEALRNFRQSGGWSVGADASIAMLRVGANGAIDINVAQSAPTIAFVLTNAGLMANLTLKGTRVSAIE